MSNANAFVAQEAEEAMSFSVRIAGIDLLGVSICCWLFHFVPESWTLTRGGSGDHRRLPAARTRLAAKRHPASHSTIGHGQGVG